MSTLFDPQTEPVPPAESLPTHHGAFERLGSVLGRTHCSGIFAVIADIAEENRRAKRAHWTFEQYDRLFAAAMTPEPKWQIVIIPLIHIRRRYLAARAAHLSAWQFAQQEQRFRDTIAQTEARLRAMTAEAEARSKAKGYANLVAENEVKERARRDARENVNAERPRASGRVTKARPGTSPLPPAPTGAFGDRSSDGDGEYIPPDPF